MGLTNVICLLSISVWQVFEERFDFVSPSSATGAWEGSLANLHGTRSVEGSAYSRSRSDDRRRQNAIWKMRAVARRTKATLYRRPKYFSRMVFWVSGARDARLMAFQPLSSFTFGAMDLAAASGFSLYLRASTSAFDTQ